MLNFSRHILVARPVALPARISTHHSSFQPLYKTESDNIKYLERKSIRFFRTDIPYWLGGTIAVLGTLSRTVWGRGVALIGIIISIVKAAYDYKNL